MESVGLLGVLLEESLELGGGVLGVVMLPDVVAFGSAELGVLGVLLLDGVVLLAGALRSFE